MTGFLSLPLCSSCRYQILCSCTLFCNIKILVCEAISIFVEVRTALKSEVNLLRYRCFIRMMIYNENSSHHQHLHHWLWLSQLTVICNSTPIGQSSFLTPLGIRDGKCKHFFSKSSFYSVFQCFCPFLFLLSLSHACRASGQFWQLYLQYERVPCSIRQRSQGTTLFSF